MSGQSKKRLKKPNYFRTKFVNSLNKAKTNYISRSVRETYKDFCKETSLHGCKFIFDNYFGRNTSSRIRKICRKVITIIWTISIIIGIIFAYYLISLIWFRFKMRPTFTTVETNNYPIWNVPFPGVTICNVNSVQKSNTKNLSEELIKRGFSKQNIKMYFRSLSALINFEEVDKEFLHIWQTLEDMNYTTEKIMFEVAQPCDRLLKHCIWLGHEVPCKNLFRVAKSAEGFCCSFNYKALRSKFEIGFRRFFSLFLWITVVCLGLIFGIFLMARVWIRYKTTPTIMTIETNNYPIWNVAFPGVTICNVNTVYKPNIHNLTEILKSHGIQENTTSLFFQSLAALVNFQEINMEFLRIFGILENLGYTSEKMMFELSQPCENMLKDCSWMGKRVPCGNLFRVAKSALGFCCSFNYKALRFGLEIETKIDDYYQINTPVIRISGAGEDVGLRVLLDVEPEEYVAAKRFFYGAEIIIHDAEDFPEKSLLTAFGQPGFEVSIAVMPSVVVTEQNAKTLPVNLRFCRFSNEKKLQITKKYSFQSCITECKAITVLQKCDCLPFFYPPLYYSNSSVNYRQCTLKDVKCLSDNKHVFSSLEPPPSITEEMYNTLNITNIGMNCDCLPSCTEQIYQMQTFVSQRFDDMDELNKTAMHFNNSNVSNLTLIKVYFKDLSCIKYRREIFMTWDDLLASFGGIFGLCLGGSVLSLVEIIYFSTFKLYAKILHNKAELEKEKAKEQQLNNSYQINFNKKKFVPISVKVHRQKEFLW